MNKKHSYFQRRQLRQLVIEADVMRMSTDESLAFIKDKSSGTLDISESELYKTKRKIRDSASPELDKLERNRTIFLHEFVFKRIYELEKITQEEWKMYIQNKNPYVKQNCLSELHKLTITMLELSGLLKEYSGSQMYNNEEIRSEIFYEQQQQQQPESEQQQQQQYRDPQEKF